MAVPPVRGEVEAAQDSQMPEPRTSGPPIAPDRPPRGDDVRLEQPERDGNVKPELDEDRDRREEEERLREERRRDDRRRDEQRDDDYDDRGADPPRHDEEPYER
jgi:hypothetical protein